MPGTNLGGTSEADGSFSGNLFVRDRVFTLRGHTAPDGYYIASIRQGARDALRDGVLVEGLDTNLDVRVVKSSRISAG